MKRKQWKAHGLICVVGHSPAGVLCGYVGVSEISPLFGKGYYDLDFEVYGGLTYADSNKLNRDYPIKTESETWFFGFDSGHGIDLNEQTMKVQTELLAFQIANY